MKRNVCLFLEAEWRNSKQQHSKQHLFFKLDVDILTIGMTDTTRSCLYHFYSLFYIMMRHSAANLITTWEENISKAMERWQGSWIGLEKNLVHNQLGFRGSIISVHATTYLTLFSGYNIDFISEIFHWLLFALSGILAGIVISSPLSI